MSAAIAGIGATEFSKDSGRSELRLAAEAVRAALADAALRPSDVDGLVIFTMDSNAEIAVARELGIPGLTFFSQIGYGGGAACATVHQAAMAIATGAASVVVCYRALNERSGRRFGRVAAGAVAVPTTSGIDNGWHYPMGIATPAATVAMLARRYMHFCGATSEDFGRVTVADRRHAASNPQAWFYQRPVTLAEHQASRWIAEPLRLLDCCQESDGAVAVVVTSLDRARDLPHRPAVIRAAAQGAGPDQFTMTSYYRDDLTGLPEMGLVAGQLWRQARIGPANVRTAVLYDHFTPYVLIQLEELGFCGRGEARDFIAGGAIELGGRLPVNPHGGQLGEAYIHGMNGIAEAVRQVRGTSVNQVPGDGPVLVTAGTGVPTSGLILSGASGLSPGWLPFKRVMDPATGLRSDVDLAEPREAADWLRGHGVTLAAVTLIAIQLLLMGDLLAHSYFRQDDFSYLYRGLDSGFGWKFLMWEDAGHLQPLGMALAWVLARVSLYNWPLTCAVTVLLLAAVSFAMLRTLRTLFGNSPAILVLLTVFLFSPLQIAGTAWWSVVINVLPLELALVLAVDAHVRYLRGGRKRNAAAAAWWLLVALAASDKGVMVPLLLFGLTAAFFVPGPLPAAAVRAAARYWRLWLGYAVLMAAWGAVYVSQLSGSTVKPDSASDVLSFVSTFTGSTLLPAVLGGPWRWSAIGYDIVSPPAALQQLSWAVAIVVVVVSCARRVRAWRAWAILAGWIVVADIVPVILGRLGGIPASLEAAQTRYLMDATPVLALCLGLAFLPVAGPSMAGPSMAGPSMAAEQDAIRFRVPAARRAVLLVLGVFLVGSFLSLQAFESLNRAAATAARSYIATARVAVADAPRGTLIVDGPTPASVMNRGIFGLFGYTSLVVGAIARGEPARHLSWTESPRGAVGNLMIFNDLGQLLPVTMQGPFSSPPPDGQGCWNVTTTATQIPLGGPLFRWVWTARVDYSGPSSSVLAFRFGENWTQVTLPAGTHTAYIPVTGQGREVSVRLAQPGPALCLTGMRVGSLEPDQASLAIPAVPAGAAPPPTVTAPPVPPAPASRPAASRPSA